MKKILFLVVSVMVAVTAGAVVKPGVEVLRDGGFAPLQGKRVGLVTNPSGIDNNLKSTVDILHEAPGVKLVALFGPEHGVRGNAHAGDAVGDAVDPLTGIKMYSLFGKTHEPTAEMLKGRTSIIVAHRLSTIKNCDRILYISNKGVAEMGSHAELMAKRGLYYQLYTAQVREEAA